MDAAVFSMRLGGQGATWSTSERRACWRTRGRGPETNGECGLRHEHRHHITPCQVTRPRNVLAPAYSKAFPRWPGCVFGFGAAGAFVCIHAFWHSFLVQPQPSDHGASNGMSPHEQQSLICIRLAPGLRTELRIEGAQGVKSPKIDATGSDAVKVKPETTSAHGFPGCRRSGGTQRRS